MLCGAGAAMCNDGRHSVEQGSGPAVAFLSRLHSTGLPCLFTIHCLSQTKRSSQVLEQKSLHIADLSQLARFATLHLRRPSNIQSHQNRCKKSSRTGGWEEKQGARGQHIGRRSVNSELLIQGEIHKMC